MTKVYVPCRVAHLPERETYAGAMFAQSINRANSPPRDMFARLGIVPSPQHIAIATAKYWGSGGVRATVSFKEPTSAALQERILSHMNAWGAWGNVHFDIFQGAWTGADCRISRGPGGYYSYEGTDNGHISKNEHTMNLEGFVMSTPESEFVRVVRHETGHYLGCEHEHKRPAIVKRLDPQKTIALFTRTQGWTVADIWQQVLTADREDELTATPIAYVDSIMCYEFPASITVDNVEIPGGTDITKEDAAFIAIQYPKKVLPPIVVPPVIQPPVVTPPITLPGVSIVDVATFFANLNKLFADYAAKNYYAVAQDALALVQAILNGIQGAPAHAMMSHSVAQHNLLTSAALMSTDDIIAKIQEATGSPDAGSLAINVLLPLLLTLAQKLIFGL